MERAPTLLGWPTSRLSRSAQYFLSLCGIYGFFALSAHAHVLVNQKYRLWDPIFLSFVQLFAVAFPCLPAVIRLFKSKRQVASDLGLYFLVALCLFFSMGFDNFAAFHMSHETEVLFKSPKVLAVLVGSVRFLRGKFRIPEVASIVVVVVGFIMLSLCDISYKHAYNVPGIAAVVVSLIFEAVVANAQEVILREHQIEPVELMGILFGMAALVAFVFTLVNDELFSSLEKMRRCPEAIPLVLLVSIMGSIGTHFIFYSQAVFGSVETVLFTSLRKSLGGFCHALWMGKMQFTVLHGMSLFAILLGMSGNYYWTVKEQGKDEDVDDLSGFDQEEADDEFSNDPMDSDFTLDD